MTSGPIRTGVVDVQSSWGHEEVVMNDVALISRMPLGRRSK
jgi:hypothetical protein